MIGMGGGCIAWKGRVGGCYIVVVRHRDAGRCMMRSGGFGVMEEGLERKACAAFRRFYWAGDKYAFVVGFCNAESLNFHDL